MPRQRKKRRSILKYGYNGKFQSGEHGSEDYRPPETAHSFYCNVYPEETDTYFEGTHFGGSVLRVRIIPISMYEVKISGYNGVFVIKHYNSEYALLQRGKSGKPGCKRFLVPAETIENNRLRAAERI